MDSRIRLVSLFFLIAFSAVIFRLFFWQIIKANELIEKAKFQYQHTSEIVAPRGQILADDNSYLAGTVEGWMVYVYKPELKENLEDVVNRLSPIIAAYRNSMEDNKVQVDVVKITC